jgi:hypothetical protein
MAGEMWFAMLLRRSREVEGEGLEGEEEEAEGAMMGREKIKDKKRQLRKD